MKVTAGNQLKGIIKRRKTGMIMGDAVIIQEGGGEVYAVIKSTEIMVGVD